MGNWRTVRIEGTCAAEDIPRLNRQLTYDYGSSDNPPLSCLGWGSAPSMCGLNRWPAETINIVGNLHERDYEVEDVADELRKLVEVAPSLRVFIDCGGDYESTDCVATVAVSEDGTVGVLPPRVAILPEIPEGQMLANMVQALRL